MLEIGATEAQILKQWSGATAVISVIMELNDAYETDDDILVVRCSEIENEWVEREISSSPSARGWKSRE